VNPAAIASNTTGAVTLLNGIAPGTSMAQRVGHVIHMSYLDMRCYTTVTAGTGVDQTHRVLLVLDKQCNGAAPAVTDVLTYASTMSPYNLYNRKRFLILMDRTFNLNAVAQGGSHKSWNVHKSIPYEVTYNAGTAGTVADIITNSLYLVIVGSEAAGVTAGTSNVYSRLRFSDQ
jgi:hypothetical protein